MRNKMTQEEKILRDSVYEARGELIKLRHELEFAKFIKESNDCDFEERFEINESKAKNLIIYWQKRLDFFKQKKVNYIASNGMKDYESFPKDIDSDNLVPVEINKV